MAKCEFYREGKCISSQMRKALEYSYAIVGSRMVTSWEASSFIMRSQTGTGYDCAEQGSCPGKTYTVSLRTQTSVRSG